jgi:hypothetical protein
MTRKHFELIAQTLADADLDPFALASVAQDFAEAFVQVNPNFDRTKFLRACGVGA